MYIYICIYIYIYREREREREGYVDICKYLKLCQNKNNTYLIMSCKMSY